MINVVEQLQQATKDQGDAAMASTKTLTTSIQAIATAHADYTKRRRPPNFMLTSSSSEAARSIDREE